ncbi:uncharacterized protein [Rutidosis leptorrhynchoides]|uniref:uncharacterized protein isoform X2 n=1 Tax=Rutidosis leptorrhynchoides TaxID=125765 RepID=UPI003A99103F
MSLENEDDSSSVVVIESVTESEKKPRITYARDFLISLSELEICKKLPSGCDQSVLSELEQPRALGSLPLQGFRRNDYSSSPPTRGDSRGYGRWDNRSSGWSDKDKDPDSQSDLDQDSGRRGLGNQSRRPWQNSEHDGLLGSGSLPRPSGFTAGTSAPKGPTNEHHHLNRSKEPYQPPRPYKAVSHSRPNTHDSFNDETFGSSESTSQDRAEEERKRRASFELMRKEQQKVLQEKQKLSGNRLKSDEFTDLITEETKEEGLELNFEVKSVSKDDSEKSSALLQSSKPRPPVPPGFAKPISSIDKENPKPRIEEIPAVAKAILTQNGTLDDQVMGISGFPGVNEADNGASQETTMSILGKFFGTTSSIKDGGSTNFVEKVKPDDPPSPNNAQSSRFSLWFNEDGIETNPVGDVSSNRPNDLLSLIGGGEKAIISTDNVAPFGITTTPSDSKDLYNNFRQESAPAPVPPVAAVLTCEDLEQAMLSQYTEKTPNLQPHIPEWSVSGQDNLDDARVVDNHATNHLLSLLQKGTVVDNTSDTNIGLVADYVEKSEDTKQEINSGQNLSLESLFGSAFMKELQSAQAPVSAQRGSVGSAQIDIFDPHELSGPVINDGIGPNMKQPAKSNQAESWSNFDGQQVIGTGEIQLPEEESLLMVNDPANAAHNQNIGKSLFSDVPFDISEKLAALGSGFRGGQEGSRFDHWPERQFNNNNLHGQALSPQMNAAQMNQNRRPVFHPLDPMNSQMRFPDQQFSARPFHQHPDSRVTGFDVPVHPQMLPPQMRMQGNFPPPQLLRDFPRPMHPGNQTPNFMPDRESMHGLPFTHQQANIGGLGMPLPVPDGSSGANRPEAFQRMMEMELRAQLKQQHNQGVFGGADLDMGFRYR